MPISKGSRLAAQVKRSVCPTVLKMVFEFDMGIYPRSNPVCNSVLPLFNKNLRCLFWPLKCRLVAGPGRISIWGRDEGRTKQQLRNLGIDLSWLFERRNVASVLDRAKG